MRRAFVTASRTLVVRASPVPRARAAVLAPCSAKAFLSTSSRLFAETPVEEKVGAVESTSQDISQTATEPKEQIESADNALREESAQEAVLSPEEKTARTCFIGGISWNVDTPWLGEAIETLLDQTGSVVAVRIARNNMGKSKGFGFVELASEDLAIKLAQIGTLELDGKESQIVRSTSSQDRETRIRERRSGSAPLIEVRNTPSPSLYLGNLNWSSNEDGVVEALSRFGSVGRVFIPVDKFSGRPRGIAFVDMGSTEEAQAAVDRAHAEGIEIDGRRVRLDFAAAQRSQRDYRGGEQGDRQNSRRGGGGGRDREYGRRNDGERSSSRSAFSNRY